MTDDDRLRAELEVLEGAAPADLAPRPSLTRRSRSLRLAAPLAIVAMAGVVLGIGVTNWLETVGPLPLASAGSGQPDASESPIELVWTSHAFPDPNAELVPRRITNIGGRLLITGGTGSGPAAWYSDDGGASWIRSGFALSAIPGAAPAGHTAMGPVAQSGGQLVSISEPFLDESSTGEVWVSGDLGATWTLVTSAPSLLTDVVGGPDRFVAVGVGGPGPGGDATAVIAHVAIWYSVDGYTWEPAEDQPSFAGAFATGLAEIRGRYALVGGKEGPVDGPSAVIWGSADGMTWEAAELPAGLGTIAGIDAGPDGFVAVGGTSVPWEGSTATLWRSADAITWVPSELSIVSGRANDSALALQPTDVVAGSGGILVTGFSPSVRSASSFTWLVRPQAGIGVLQDASFISDAAPREEGFVAIRICHPIQCEIPIELVFGAAAGNAPEGLAMVDRPSTAPDIDCGSLDSDTCSRVLESVYSQHEPQRVGTVVSIAVGPPICFEASCDSVEDVGRAVGVTIDFAARTWPLQLNCPLRADTDQWLCIAASRVLDGVPDLGVPYGVTTYTHCGLRAVNFDEDRWAIEGVLDDGSGNPPDGFGNPTDAGTVTLVAPDEGIYRSFYGVERRITRGGGLPPVEGCL